MGAQTHDPSTKRRTLPRQSQRASLDEVAGEVCGALLGGRPVAVRCGTCVAASPRGFSFYLPVTKTVAAQHLSGCRLLLGVGVVMYVTRTPSLVWMPRPHLSLSVVGLSVLPVTSFENRSSNSGGFSTVLFITTAFACS